MNEVTNQTTDPSQTATDAPKPQFSSADKERNQQIHHGIAVCSLAVIGCFFLPWVNLVIGKASGWELQQGADVKMKLVWLIPAMAVFSLIAGIRGKEAHIVAPLAGATPFLALAFYSSEVGSDLYKIFEIGAYLTLSLGAALIVLPSFLKKPQP